MTSHRGALFSSNIFLCPVSGVGWLFWRQPDKIIKVRDCVSCPFSVGSLLSSSLLLGCFPLAGGQGHYSQSVWSCRAGLHTELISKILIQLALSAVGSLQRKAVCGSLLL